MKLTIAAALKQAEAMLAAASPSARLDAEILLAALLQESRSYLLIHPEKTLAIDLLARFQKCLERRATGTPVAYLTGRREFWSLELEVTPDVLVPRPETELLVETALEILPYNRPVKVLDLGTGSGAIALALAHERHLAQVFATDISESALAVARGNAARLKLRNITFLPGSWYAPAGMRRFDLIVSNPPYIAAGDPALLAPELAAEPRGALTPGPSGLEAIEHIAAHAADYLRKDGSLLVEHGATQGPAVAALFSRCGLSNIRSLRDLAGRDRAACAMK